MSAHLPLASWAGEYVRAQRRPPAGPVEAWDTRRDLLVPVQDPTPEAPMGCSGASVDEGSELVVTQTDGSTWRFSPNNWDLACSHHVVPSESGLAAALGYQTQSSWNEFGSVGGQGYGIEVHARGAERPLLRLFHEVESVEYFQVVALSDGGTLVAYALDGRLHLLGTDQEQVLHPPDLPNAEAMCAAFHPAGHLAIVLWVEGEAAGRIFVADYEDGRLWPR